MSTSSRGRQLSLLQGLYGALLLLALLPCAATIGQTKCVVFSASEKTETLFSVVEDGTAAPILTSSDDWPGVHRAVLDFQADIAKVTDVTPKASNFSSNDTSSSSEGIPFIIGTLGHSSLIDDVVNNTGLDVSIVENQWDAFMGQVVQNPLPGIDSAYVIIGADKRGTIYGMYDLSEQFGVSPWYWWADVPTTKHKELFIQSSGCSHGTPTIKYRGIFLNDEQPALQNWAMEKFTNGTGSVPLNSPFNSKFYAKLFELLLRLKANYLWPAMWGSAFAVDDPLNQPLADYFGIAMGTSHQEPMARSTPNEFSMITSTPWNYATNSELIYEFWVNGTERAKPYETVFTIGMRGAGDLPLEDAGIDLLEKIIADQRQILTDVFNGTDVTTIPQIWTLYSEVEGYYEDGLKVPDDVILLWADDNWGNVRRYPTADERNRTGGAGVYYHVDYVGSPRDYKWVESTQLSKMYEQLSLAVDRNATSLWILNVGDLKPYERDTEFFLTLAWNSTVWNKDNLDTYVNSWAEREFDLSAEDASAVSDVIANLTRFNFRKKPELMNATTFSVVNYREADTMLEEWTALNESSTKLYDSLSEDMKPAFFQMVHHPVKASANLAKMWIAAGKNNVRVTQARLSANQLADTVEDCFGVDYDLEEEYHTMLDGKWDHMMDQTHVGYFYWQQPMTNSMPMISRVQARKQALPGPMRISPEGTLGAWPGDNQNQCTNGYNCGNAMMTLDSFNTFRSRYIDVGAAGPNPFTFTVQSNASWLSITPSQGSVSPSEPEQRVVFSVKDWSSISGNATAQITFTATAKGQPTAQVPVSLVAIKHTVPDDFSGFVEGDGVVSMEAAHASRNTSVSGVTWTELPGFGRTLSAVTPWPRMGNDGNNFTAGSGPSIEYDFYTFNAMGNGTIKVQTYITPTLNNQGPNRPMGVAMQVDDEPIQTSHFVADNPPGQYLPAGWNDYIADAIMMVYQTFKASPGAHTLKIWMIEPGIVIQKVVVDTGALKPTFLGPPESIRV